MARSAAAKNAAATPRNSPAPEQTPIRQKANKVKKADDYSSDGVEDNDVFLLPISDFQVTLGVTILAAVVRLFRIYQPTSVVFDEVQ
jgi:dolichyl-phosphate-mannose-protein mannosyltransferase